MPRRLFGKLVVAHLIVVGLTLLAAWALSAWLMRGAYIRVRGDQLIAEARRIADVAAPMVEDEGEHPALKEAVAQIGDVLGARVCVVDEGGQLIAQSGICGTLKGVNPQLCQVEEALRGKIGIETKELCYFGIPMLSISVPVRDERGRVIGAVFLHSPLNAELATLRRLQFAILWAGIGAILLSTLIALWLSRRIAHPLREMSGLARKMAQGDFKSRLDVNDGGEVGELAASFNDLAAALSETMAALRSEQSKLAGVIAGVSEGVVAVDTFGAIILANPPARGPLQLVREGEGGTLQFQCDGVLDLFKECLSSRQLVAGDLPLDDCGRALLARVAPVVGEAGDPDGAVGIFLDVTESRRTEDLRRQLLANVSHELRTPLTSIRAFAEALVDGAAGEAQDATRCAHVILDETIRLNRLVTDLMNLSKMEAGTLELRIEPVDLCEVVHGAGESVTAFAESHGVEVRAAEDADEILVEADEGRLFEVLRNLLDNAIRFSPEGGVVQVETHVEDGHAAVSVTDEGLGIETHELEKTWDRFYAGAASRARGGTGLGLAIVKHLVELHGGRVFARSEVGHGSTFGFRLPLARREH